MRVSGRITHILASGLAAATALFWAGGAFAARDVALIDGAATAQAAGLQATPVVKRGSGGVEVNLNGSGKDGDETFLYLKGDYSATPPGSSHSDISAPDDDTSGALTGAEVTGLVGSFTPSHAHLRLGYATMVGKPGKKHPGLDIAVTSNLATDGGDAFNPLGVDLSGADIGGRAVNLGLSLGYAGFNLDAAYLTGGQGLDYGYKGYDVGLGYQRGNWGTLLGFSGVQPTSSSLGTDILGTQSQYTMRLGAFYQIWPGFTLGGRFQFHDYQLFDSERSKNRGEFFLNTKLHF